MAKQKQNAFNVLTQLIKYYVELLAHSAVVMMLLCAF